MEDRELLACVEALEATYLDIWEDVCDLESPTSDKAGVDAVGAYFIRLAKAHGWRVEVFEQPVSGNVVCITMNPDAKAAPVTLSGHMDTVHPCGSFGEKPVSRDTERMYGPGVTDCKGGIVAGFLAMHALQTCGFLGRPVRMLLQTDEEGSSKASGKATIRYMCEKAKDSIAFLNLEGNSDGVVCLSRKGIVTFRFTVTGEEAHASMCAVKGASAIADAAHKILALEALKDDDGVTCSVGVVHGGTVPNTVPGRCEFVANVRFVTNEQCEQMKAFAEKLAATVHVQGCRCEVSIDGERPAMELTERNLRLFDAINRIYAEHGMPMLTHRRRNGGSDAADVTAFGIPCVESLGVTGGAIHSPNEYAMLSSLCEAAKRLAVAIRYL